MRKNHNLVIRGEKVLLVPYRREHVVTYHNWMQDPQLQESTASDPLTLSEEYQMQQSWANDDDKCTFILLDPDLGETDVTKSRGAGMAGDVNLFINDPEHRHTAEIEVMVAEPQSRGKGLAYEALILLMLYANTELGLNKFVAKIGFDNVASQKLFRKLGFQEQTKSAIFRETTFALSIEEGTTAWLRQQCSQCVKYEPYE